MNDGRYAFEAALDGGLVTHVADHQLDPRIEVSRPAALGPVYLRRQLVERAHRIASPEQLVGQMGADEAGTARDEYTFHPHPVPARVEGSTTLVPGMGTRVECFAENAIQLDGRPLNAA